MMTKRERLNRTGRRKGTLLDHNQNMKRLDLQNQLLHAYLSDRNKMTRSEYSEDFSVPQFSAPLSPAEKIHMGNEIYNSYTCFSL